MARFVWNLIGRPQSPLERASAKIPGSMEILEDARRALLSRLIDHAPLFPPASMELPDALAEDARARESPASFMLARFVCPASILGEVPDVGRGVSVVLDGPLVGEARVESVETRPSDGLDALATLAPEVYVEVFVDDALEERLDAVAAHGFRAKVRCGGASVPEVADLARFIRACRERELVFKATAGLHRAVHDDGEHGFVNLLAAVVFGNEESALAESDPAAFSLGPDGFTWRGRSAGAAELGRARRERFQSIGSCSFFEPVDELAALEVLPL